ncbi:hypothetical protein IWX49DRAFT_167921 [Phyllosticta citricarpa]
MQFVSSRLVSRRIDSFRRGRTSFSLPTCRQPFLSGSPALAPGSLQCVMASNGCSLGTFKRQPRPYSAHATQEASIPAGACVEDVGCPEERMRKGGGEQIGPDSHKQKQAKADSRIEAKLYDCGGKNGEEEAEDNDAVCMPALVVGLARSHARAHAPPKLRLDAMMRGPTLPAQALPACCQPEATVREGCVLCASFFLSTCKGSGGGSGVSGFARWLRPHR